MAARSHVHVDTAVSERRLRPIYDYLDNGNNKKALQEAEKLIKKQKDSKDVLCARALKALALIRLTRQDEALAVIKDVHSEGPTDDATLQAMTICYRELQKPELIANAYEIATKKDPQNEELLSHLFMSYVRNGQYKKQQQTAMALYKLKPKNPYYFWAVMSIVMQASSEDEKLAKTFFLPLAERMAVKFVNEDKIEAEAEVELYLMILELQEKYAEALQVLDGPLKDKLSGYLDLLPKKQAELLSKMERWPETSAAYKKLILSNPDQWSYYLAYFKALTNLVNSGWEPTENKDSLDVDYKFEHAVELISALIEEQSNASENRILRGPYLAQIELLQLLLKRNDPLAAKIGTIVDVLASYYTTFGSKPSCYMDIAHVVSSVSLSEEEIAVLLEKMQQTLISDLPNDTLPKDMKSLYKHLCYSQMCLFLGHYDSWSDQQKLAVVKELSERYQNGLELGATLLPTEFQPCDNYSLLSAYMVTDLWRKTGDERLIAQAISLLEQGLKGSPSNFQIKLVLIKLYNVIGAVGASFALYESIDVKHIQQETLGYLITEPLLSGAYFTTSSTILGSSIRFFIGNYKDTVDYIISCYKFGSFTKIPEIVNFRKKLNESLYYSLVKTEKLILDLLLEIRSQQDMEKAMTSIDFDPEKDISLEGVTDNRDFSIFRLWNCKDRIDVDEQIVKSFEEKITWVKIRNVIVRSMITVFRLTKSTTHANNTHHNEITNGEKRCLPDVLSDILANLKDIIESIDKDSLITNIFPIQAPGPTRLLRYIQENYLDIFISLLELVLNLHRLAESSADAEEKSCLKIIADLKKLFQALLKKMEHTISSNQTAMKPTQIRIILEDFTNSIEIFGLGTILIGQSHVLLKPARSSAMRKGKKKKENVHQVAAEIFQQLDTLLSTTESVGEGLLELLNQIDTSLLSSRLGIMSLCDTEILEDKPDIVQEITKRVENSYHNSIKELKDILQTKIKYLQLLKW